MELPQDERSSKVIIAMFIHQFFLEDHAKGPLLYTLVDDPDFQLLKSILPVGEER